MAKSIKAVRAEIWLGSIPLSVYQLPDGSYRLSGRSVTDAVQKLNKSLSRRLGVKSLKDLPRADSSLSQVKAETGETFIPVAIETAIDYWALIAEDGEKLAIAILKACAAEAIERRADAAFGIIRSEEERNERAEARLSGKEVRRTLTDAIRDYCDRHPELPENTVKWMYCNVTDAIYMAIFGMTAIQLEKVLDCDRNKSRDYMASKSLKDLEFVEDMVCRQIDNSEVAPMDAVTASIKFAGIKVSKVQALQQQK